MNEAEYNDLIPRLLELVEGNVIDGASAAGKFLAA